jgi:hypothetical protein
METVANNLVWRWVTSTANALPQIETSLYCPTRDVFQARLDTMTQALLQRQTLPETMIYLLAAMAGEIGNNLLSMP